MSAIARQLGNKKCSNCFRIRPLERFYPKRDRKRGVDTWQARCKDCNAEVVAAWKDRRPQVYRAIYNRAHARRKAAGS